MSKIELNKVEGFLQNLGAPPFSDQDINFISDVLLRGDNFSRFRIYEELHKYYEEKLVINLAVDGLNDDDWLIRVECLEILGDAEYSKAIPSIRRIVDYDKINLCVNAAVVTLGEIGDEDYLKSISEDDYFKDEYNKLSLSVALYLSCSDGSVSIRDILNYLNSEDDRVVIAAANLLDSFGFEVDLNTIVSELVKVKKKIKIWLFSLHLRVL